MWTCGTGTCPGSTLNQAAWITAEFAVIRRSANFRLRPLSPFEQVYRISRLTHVLLVANLPHPAHERHRVRRKSGMHAIRFLHVWEPPRQSAVGSPKRIFL